MFTEGHFTPKLLFRSKFDIVPLLLREVPPERVTFMEELGRGAFGKVHKGVLREFPNREEFLKPREERVDVGEGRMVAIKVLLGEMIKLSYLLWLLNYITQYSQRTIAIHEQRGTTSGSFTLSARKRKEKTKETVADAQLFLKQTWKG